MIETGKVEIDGMVATLGSRVCPGQRVKVDGRLISREEEMVLLAVNKPRGVVCTTDTRWGDQTIYELLNYPKRIFSIGRLDKDSEGLLLMTNNGDILNKIMRAGNYHEKEYLVSVNKPVTEEFCRKMSRGVAILDTVTRPCKVEKTGEKSFRIILTQGLNRQIRRMCETLGYRVMTLQRVRIMNIRLGSLKEGTWRNIEGEERKELDALLSDSSSLSVKERNEKQRERRGGI